MKKIKTKLHHFAYNIRPNTLEKVLELFEILGCEMSYRESEEARWCMMEQKPISVDIQLIERDYEVVEIEKKQNTHIAFLSDNPVSKIEKIEKWAEENNLKFRTDGWNEKERWFDFPDLFVNFVVEIMHNSVVE